MCGFPSTPEGCGVGVPSGPITLTSYIVDKLKHVGPAGTPLQPSRSNMQISNFQPLEAKFEKVDFTKNVGLAMLNHVHFDKY